MSILIDRLIRQVKDGPQACFDDVWYVAKPMEIFSIRDRMRDAWRVLLGKSKAYHYKRDVGK